MAKTSVPPVLSSSTAIQQQLYAIHYGTDYSHVSNSYQNAFEHTSPISSKEHFKCTLCKLYPNLYSYCSIHHCHSRKGTFLGVPRKLEFTNEISADENESNDNTRKETKKDSTVKDFSITKLLKCFPTEKNYFINSFVKNTNSSNNDDSGNSSYLDNDSEDTESGYSLLDFEKNINKSSESNQNATRHKDFHPPKFDFLHELNERNCFSILSCILSFFSDEDIRKVNNVCKEWREIVSSDKSANERLKAYIKKKKDLATGSQKENKTSKRTPERGHKSAFFTLTNSPVEVTPLPLHHSQSPGRFNCFIEEARKLQKEEVMIKCPKCCYPSRAESGNKHCCSRTLCQHVFCSICLSPRQDEHLCSEPKLNFALSSIKIGSKQSRRNLRRL